MNTKIESSTNQSLISKLKFLLWDAKSWTSQLIELAPIVCLNPLRDVNPRNQNWIPYTQYIKKLAQRWVFTRLWINSKILFDEAAQLLSIIIHELAFWMVSNHGCTCPFALILMNFILAKTNSTYTFKMNVPKNCKESEECLQIFNTAGTPAYPSMRTALQQRSRE
jgi:uncharacterized membrane protein